MTSQMTTAITNFCDSKNILWFPIIIKSTPTDKIQNGETKFHKELKPVEYYKSKDNQFGYPKSTDFETLTEEQIKNRQSLLFKYPNQFNSIAIDCRKYHQIDFDTPNYPEELNDFICANPYYTSSTKSYGKHVFIETNIPNAVDKTKLYETDDGDVEMLTKWSWASLDTKIENIDNRIIYYTPNEMELYGYNPKQKKEYKSNINNVSNNSNNTNNCTNETNNKYIELMNLIGNKIKRDNWLKLTSWAVNYISKNQYLDFVDIEWKNDAEKLWNEFYNNKRETSILTIANIAKDVCPEKYKQWRQNHNLLITMNILQKGEADICEYIKPDLINKLVYCNNIWYGYNDNTKMWERGISPTHIIVRHIQNEISLLLSVLQFKLTNLFGEERNKMEEDIKELNSIYKKATSNGFSSQCKKSLEYLLLDNDFYKKINNIPYRIPFKNGILNLKTMQLESIQAEDFLTNRINREYKRADEETIKTLKDELRKICNCNDIHLNYYLSSIGYAFCGVSDKEQLFWSLYGATASNGKSTIFDALKVICPEIVSRVESDFYEINEKGRHKTLDTLTGLTRILYANELSKKKQDKEFIKQIADGTSMPYKQMYGNKVDLPVNFKAFIISNNILNFENDNGISRRIRTCEFTSSFRDFPVNIPEKRQFIADKDFPRKLKEEYSDALLDIIFEYANKYYTNNKLEPYPSEWNEENDNVINMNDVYGEIYKELEFGESCFASKNDISTLLQKYEKTYNQKEFLNELRRLPEYNSYNIHYESQKEKIINGKKAKGFWVGLKIKEKQTDEFDDSIEE
jgi:phage/plasmid-associated DNA primase